MTQTLAILTTFVKTSVATEILFWEARTHLLGLALVMELYICPKERFHLCYPPATICTALIALKNACSGALTYVRTTHILSFAIVTRDVLALRVVRVFQGVISRM